MAITPIGFADIYRYCLAHQGYQVGDGECVSLAHYALVANRYRTFTELGPVGRNADYRWGQPISYKEAGPGCIIQFKNVTFRWVYNKQTYTYSRDGDIAHHTAVICGHRVNHDFEIFQQNYGLSDGRQVRRVGRGMFHLTQMAKGSVWFYRPVKR